LNHTEQWCPISTSPTIVELGAKKHSSAINGDLSRTGKISAICPKILCLVIQLSVVDNPSYNAGPYSLSAA